MSDPQVAPTCLRCRRRHRPDLKCWRGVHSRDLTALVLSHSRACWISGPKCKGTATTADHVIPRSKGGGDDLENLRPACGPCNSSRGTNSNPFTTEAETPAAGVPLSPRWRTGAAATPETEGSADAAPAAPPALDPWPEGDGPPPPVRLSPRWR